MTDMKQGSPGRVWRLAVMPAVLMWLLPVVRAADTVNLVVQATAVTGSCTPSLDTPVVNLGSIRYDALNAGTPTVLPEKTVQLTLTCSSPMAVGWSITDNRPDSVAGLAVNLQGRSYTGTSLAGLGKTPGGVSLGNWAISTGLAGTVQHDGTGGNAIVSSDTGSTWSGTAGVAMAPGFGGGGVISVSETAGGQPIPLSTGTFTLGIGGVLAPRNTLGLTDDTRLDGSATISVVYL